MLATDSTRTREILNRLVSAEALLREALHEMEGDCVLADSKSDYHLGVEIKVALKATFEAQAKIIIFAYEHDQIAWVPTP